MESEHEFGRTAQVRMLTVGETNFTEFLFRQLTEEPLIAEDGRSLKGKPWGRVNYHPDGCGSAGSMQDHCHVVWQLGDELMRSTVSFDYQKLFEPSLADTLYDLCVLQQVEAPIPDDLPPFGKVLISRMPDSYTMVLGWDGYGIFDRELTERGVSLENVQEWLSSVERERTYGPNPEKEQEWLSSRNSFIFTSQNHPDLQCRASMSDKAAKAVIAWRLKPPQRMLRGRESKRPPWVTRRFNAYVLALEDLRLSLKDKSFDDIKARYFTEMTAEVERQQRQRDRRGEIAALPQLFLSG